MEIENSKAIFVGGASGMCRATAIRFASKGGQLAILDLESSNGKEIAEGLGAKFYPCNVMDYDGMASVMDEAVADMGGLQFMLNTAGGGLAQKTVKRDGSRHSLSDFRKVIDLNLIASFNINAIAAEHMAKNEPNDVGERGVMINTASIAAFEGQIGQVAYSAAKGGITAMTLTMARDLGSLGIRCMTIAPSLFDTGLTAGIPDEGALQLTKDAAFPRRMGHPDEFAIMAISIFECAMMNGSTIRVDGGQRFAPR
ncbi:MAG: NAD(P)-dependent dehydrogenase (short-subunit alcohol dehydrogenase family) [Candidatus Azotimanducaceae bacterium]|jgi:NAD(P)-dependent dehydrogenase (short-subunit alcohol dehydrogenase family)